MRLFHFSHNPGIEIFEPRRVLVAPERPVGSEHLNEPLVWAIDEAHQSMYLFPRDCPRIITWPTAETTVLDRQRLWNGRNCRAIAYVESAWLERLQSEPLYRYELPADSFRDLRDAGMWVSSTTVVPTRVETLHDLLAELRDQDTMLYVVDSLRPLKALWATSLHVSGIRLRNAAQ